MDREYVYKLSNHDTMLIYQAIVNYAKHFEDKDRKEYKNILNKLGYKGDECE